MHMNLSLRPFIVTAIADNKFNLIFRTQQGNVGEQIPIAFARGWGFEIKNNRHAIIYVIDWHCSPSFQRNLVAGIAKPLHKLNRCGLSEGLAARHRDIVSRMFGHLRENRVERVLLPSFECISRIAVGAAQRTASESDENSRTTDGARLSLQGVENFG